MGLRQNFLKSFLNPLNISTIITIILGAAKRISKVDTKILIKTCDVNQFGWY